MADTRAATGLEAQVWDDKFFTEYQQESVFKPYMGMAENSVIQVNEDLTKKKGDTFTFSLVNRLTNDPTLDDATLEGNEEDLVSRSFDLTVHQRRHAVVVPTMQQQRSAIDLRQAARTGLKSWAMEDMRDQTIASLYSIDGVEFGSTTAANRNTWVTNNADRVQFGKLASNYSTTFASAMGNLDNTDDKATIALAALLKRKALLASPKIRPIEVSGGKRVYVVFCHPLVFRDFASSLEAVNRDAYTRGLDNPIFTGADLHYDGLVFKEVDDMPLLAASATISGVAVGNSVQASPIFLCGAQAVGLAYAQRSQTTTKTFDYGNKAGVSVSEIRGMDKMRYGTSASSDTGTPKDYGVVTCWVAAPADA